MKALGPCLVHNDYWPGNTVWFRGRLVAVVDWAGACVGDPRADVAQCRADLVFSDGLEIADTFLRSYEALAGHMPDMWYHDAFMGLRALLNYPKWLKGYHDAGMGHLKLADVAARIQAFLRRALTRRRKRYFCLSSASASTRSSGVVTLRLRVRAGDDAHRQAHELDQHRVVRHVFGSTPRGPAAAARDGTLAASAPA